MDQFLLAGQDCTCLSAGVNLIKASDVFHKTDSRKLLEFNVSAKASVA